MRNRKPRWSGAPVYRERHREWRKESGSWEYSTPLLRIAVHRYVGFDRDQWFVSCHEIGVQRQLLNTRGMDESIAAAQAEGIAFVRQRIADMAGELDGEPNA